MSMTQTQRLNQVVKTVSAWPIYIVGVLPAAWLFYQAVSNNLGADPLKALEHQLGEWALQLLIATLLITPLRDLFKINLIKYRRAIGLLAFFYALGHLLTYLWLDQQWWWSAIWKDITKRPYIIIGVISFLAMVPLAITSNNLSIRKLGPLTWRKLHQLTYIVVPLAALHFVLLKKTWQLEPILYLGVGLLLVGYRFWRKRLA
ncbi:protein-methionine-sulfoxide reductase heme-binding subunit MsrQ [Paramylibacter kogurei]|nr:protein-methionine-sulfoxide reductase heme-binding subunit MsrQ [Amylibacter kogurei]